MTTVFEVLHRKAEPYKVKLIKGQKNTYSWEITVNACDWVTAHDALVYANNDLKSKFGGGDSHEQSA